MRSSTYIITCTRRRQRKKCAQILFVSVCSQQASIHFFFLHFVSLLPYSIPFLLSLSLSCRQYFALPRLAAHTYAHYAHIKCMMIWKEWAAYAVSDYDVIFPLKDKMLPLMRWHSERPFFISTRKTAKNQNKTTHRVNLSRCVTPCVSQYMNFFILEFSNCLVGGEWDIFMRAFYGWQTCSWTSPIIDFQLCTSGELRAHVFGLTLIRWWLSTALSCMFFSAIKQDRVSFFGVVFVFRFLLPIKGKSGKSHQQKCEAHTSLQTWTMNILAITKLKFVLYVGLLWANFSMHSHF